MDDNSSLEPEDLEQDATSLPPASSEPEETAGGGRRHVSRRLFIIGLLAMLFVLVIIGIVIALTAKPAKKPATAITINTQTLSSGTLQKLTAQAGSNNSAAEQLTITPNTLFKNSLEVQGTTSLDKGLAVGGDSNLSGNLGVSGLITAASLSVGSLTIGTIHLSGDLNFGGHLVPSGTTPTAEPNVAASGGGVTISGNDTAGTITITVGSGRLLAGELATVAFQTAFATTPHIQLTPVNSSGATIEYYVTQSPTFFAVETASAPVAGTTYTYNYLVTQ